MVLMLAIFLKPQLQDFHCLVRRLSNVERTLLVGFLLVLVAYGGTKPPVPPPVPDPVVTNTIRYVNLCGAANPNPATFTTNDLPLALAPLTREGYEFLGWTPWDGVIPAGTVTNVTFAAQWEEIVDPVPPTPVLWDMAAETAFDGKSAAVYDGAIMNADGTVFGTVQVKVSKADKNGKSKVTATVQPAGEGQKKLTFKVEKGSEWTAGTMENVVLKAAKDGPDLTVQFGSHGLAGSYDGRVATGSRNFFTAKDDEAQLALGAFEGVISVAAPREDGDKWSGWETYSLTVAKKGKVKIVGTLVNGTKVSATSQMLIGKDTFCIPVVSTKKNAACAFAIWFKKPVTDFSADGLPGGSVIGRAGLDAAGMPQGNVPDGAMFAIDAADVLGVLGNAAVISNQTGVSTLPDKVSIDVEVEKKGKWTLPKAGKVALRKNAVSAYDLDTDKFGDNPSGLKLTYTAKTGAFKGSFALYEDVTTTKPKLKKWTATVNGVVVGGVGYGSAVIKKVGAMPVTVGAGCGECQP